MCLLTILLFLFVMILEKLDKLVEEIMKDVMLKAREIQNNGSK